MTGGYARQIVTSRSELPPAAAIALQQFERARGALAAGGIEFQPLGARFFPGIEERLHRLPGGFHAVGALKENVVADHAIVNQRLIARCGLGLEVVLVVELHLYAVDPDHRPRHFGVELQRDALGRLDADDEIVLSYLLDRRAPKHRKRRLAEFYRHFRAFHGERLASTQVEGDAGPAPVVDVQFHRDEGLRSAILPDIRGLAVILNLGVAHLPGDLLAAYGVSQRFLLPLGLDCRQHLVLFRT